MSTEPKAIREELAADFAEYFASIDSLPSASRALAQAAKIDTDGFPVCVFVTPPRDGYRAGVSSDPSEHGCEYMRVDVVHSAIILAMVDVTGGVEESKLKQSFAKALMIAKATAP